MAKHNVIKEWGPWCGRYIAIWIARVVYLSAISALMGLLIFVMLRPVFVRLLYYTIVPILFLILSIYILYYLEEKDVPKMIKFLGLSTLVPGCAALLIFLIGQNRVLKYVGSIGGDVAEQAFTYYVSRLPGAQAIVYAFIVLGIVLLYVHKKIK